MPRLLDSYNRAAAAAILWVIAGALPFGLPRAPDLRGNGAGGLAFLAIFTIFGLLQLYRAIRRRSLTDVFVFGVAPVAIFLVAWYLRPHDA